MKSFLVLGLGKFGVTVAMALCDLGHEVLGVDEDPRIVQEYARRMTHTIEADLTSEDFMKSIDVKQFDAAVVAVGSNMQVSIMVTVLLKELGAKYIIAKAQEDFHERVLYKIGADRVILPERDIGMKTAKIIASDNYFDMIEISPEHSILTMGPPDSWLNRSLGELAIRTKHGINIIAVKSPGSNNVIPAAATIIQPGCILTIMGTNQDLKRLGSVR